MYDVMYRNHSVGHASVETKGLYYCFTCICTLQMQGIYRLIVSDGNRSIDLGICVPENGHFVLRKRIPIKRFSGIKLQFKVITKETDFEYIPITSGMEFSCIEKISTARLQNTNGQLLLVIEKSPGRQGSDPIP